MPSEGAVRDGNSPGYELIETMRWEPSEGFVRLDRHLARLHASARELGFACDPEVVGQALSEAIGRSAGPLRVRLTLAANGEATAAAQPYQSLTESKIWTLKVARARLDSSDSLLKHKTSRRDIFVRARSEHLIQQADEVLLANERGEICEGTITNLFADFGDGVLVTPRLDCGLLPGVLRAELLDQGKAREGLIPAERLRSAKAIFVGNSLRGLITAKLAV